MSLMEAAETLQQPVSVGNMAFLWFDQDFLFGTEQISIIFILYWLFDKQAANTPCKSRFYHNTLIHHKQFKQNNHVD